jgi:hypothetical protein
MKVFRAIALLAVISYLNMHLSKSDAAGVPPSQNVIKVIKMISRSSLAFMLLSIAIVTSS